jgi:hypothetical protein
VHRSDCVVAVCFELCDVDCANAVCLDRIDVDDEAVLSQQVSDDFLFFQFIDVHRPNHRLQLRKVPLSTG